MTQPWPIVERFLQEQTCGSIGLDVGCGNGKYLTVNKNVFIVGSDRYANNPQIKTRRYRPYQGLTPLKQLHKSNINRNPTPTPQRNSSRHPKSPPPTRLLRLRNKHSSNPPPLHSHPKNRSRRIHPRNPKTGYGKSIAVLLGARTEDESSGLG